jgi:uncharacterized protein YukE
MDGALDVEYLKRAHGDRTRQGRCRGCRADFPCQPLLAAQEIERLIGQHNALDAELQKIFDRLRAVERERDEWGGKAATYQAESAAFRRQRDEVVEALSNLCAAVVKLTNEDPTHYQVANAVGLPAMVAMQLVERYRRGGAIS